MDTERLIQSYFGAWLSGDREAARSCVADSMFHVSPDGRFDGADAFFGACWALNEGFNEMDVVHGVYGPTGAYIVYRAGPEMTIGELIEVADGKIQGVYVTYNPTH